MSEGRGVRFDELVEPDQLLQDCKILKVPTRQGDITLASCSSEAILAWYAENTDENPNVRRYRGLRLVVRSIVNPDGTRVAVTTEEALAAVEKLKHRDANLNGKLLIAAFEVNGIHLVTNDQTDPKIPQVVSTGSAPTPSSTGSPTSSPSISGT